MTPADLRKILDEAELRPDDADRSGYLAAAIGADLYALVSALAYLWDSETVEDPDESRDQVVDALAVLREIPS